MESLDASKNVIKVIGMPSLEERLNSLECDASLVDFLKKRFSVSAGRNYSKEQLAAFLAMRLHDYLCKEDDAMDSREKGMVEASIPDIIDAVTDGMQVSYREELILETKKRLAQRL